MAGKISVVSTPIGNLQDLTTRALETLREATLVACEDTRRTGRLLHHLGLKKRMVSLHEHNERRRVTTLLEAVEEEGATIALTSDAGTPLLCDPGFLLIREAVARGIHVEAVPGPSAILAALVVSGLPPYPFTFAGFPPRRSGQRRRFYRRFAELDHTLVLFESPHRIAASLGDAFAELGDRQAVVVRELTKLHEEVRGSKLSDLPGLLGEMDGERVRGELVLVISGRTDPG